ncbi:MAG TPA: hypothetical protein VLA82_11285 [Actinomycetota bacterium]|nr:hypothetical protein [Actinomycetota bacterium]
MEAITVVCDVCRRPAAKTVRISVDSKNHLKDLCDAHLAELLKGARAPRRGRPRGSSPAKRGSAKASTSRAKSAKRSTRKTTARKSGARKTGARKRTASASS